MPREIAINNTRELVSPSRLFTREIMVVFLTFLGKAPPTQLSLGTPFTGSERMNRGSPKRRLYRGTHHSLVRGKVDMLKKKI